MSEELFDTSPYGHFYVSESIARFLVDLTDPHPSDKVLVVGVIAPEVAETIVSSKTDVSPEYMKGDSPPKEPDTSNTLYSVIVCAPPFGISLDSMPGRSGEPSEQVWLAWCIRHLDDNGRLAIIVPAGLLSNYSQQPIRRFLLEEGGLQAIVELPAGWAPSTATQASILFITSDSDPDRSVRMVRVVDASRVSMDNLGPLITSDQLLASDRLGTKAFSVALSRLDDSRLDAQYYDPKYTQLPAPDPGTFEPTRLGELAEIRSGERFSKEDLQFPGIPLIQVGNVTPDGHLRLRDARSVARNAATASRGYSRSGEIIVTIAGTVGKVAFLGDMAPDTGVCIDTSLRRIRVLDEDRVLPEYLALYLRSQLAQTQMERFISGSVIKVLSGANLKEVVVYLPDLAKQHELVEAFHQLVVCQGSYSCLLPTSPRRRRNVVE